MRRTAAALVRGRLGWMTLGLLLVAIAAPLAARLPQDRSVTALFPDDDPRLIHHHRTQAEFGGEATCLLAYQDAELFTPAGMERLSALAERCRKVPGVRGATSLADLPRPADPSLASGLAKSVWQASANPKKWSRWTESVGEWRPKRIADWIVDPAGPGTEMLRKELLATELFTDTFLGHDGRTTAVVMQFDLAWMADGRIASTIKELRTIGDGAPIPAKLVGAPVLVSEVFEYLTNDSRRLRYTALFAMVAVIGLLFRNIRWMLLPAGVCLAATLCTQAFMTLADIRLSLVGSLTESIITVIAVAVVIQLTVQFAEEAKGEERRAVPAMELTLTRMLRPFLWTCGITAVGFGALGVSRILPMQQYALVMVTASFFVALLTLLLVPGGALLGRRFIPALPRRAVGQSGLERCLERLAVYVGKHSRSAAGAIFGLFGVAALGFGNLKVESEFTRNFRPNSPVLTSYRFVEDHLGGAGILEMTVTADPRRRVDRERLAALTHEIRQLDGVTKVTSVLEVLDFARGLLGSQSLAGREAAPKIADDPSARPVPPGRLVSFAQNVGRSASERMLLEAFRALPPEVAKATVGAFWNPDANRLRLMIRVREQQGVHGKRALVEKLAELGAQHFPPEADARPTGMGVLLVYLIDSLVNDQWRSVEAAALGAVLTASLAFRSFRLGMIAFAPKVALVMAVIGVMGWVGLKMNVATAMIGAVSMGLVVAFSVPYIARFQEERTAGRGLDEALAITQAKSGAAMIFANLALALGFLVLTGSEFLPTVHFGALVSVAIVGGVLGNLILLPVLLRWTEPADRPAAVATVPGPLPEASP